MPIDVISEAGSSTANSFISLAEFAYYHDRRLPLDPPVTVTGDVAARSVIMATRVLSMMMQAKKTLKWDRNGKPFYYTSRTWTGSVATPTQALAWGRIGMFDRHGRGIATGVIPQELKDATSELAGQLQLSDRTLDNDIAIQGITSVKAGSVALTFKESIEAQVLPDAVYNMLVPSWLTDEQITYALKNPIFEAI